MYDRGPPETAEQTTWEGGVTWIAHPSETGQRASHAIVTDCGVWLCDPLVATNLDAILDPLGEVAGVAVLSSWHARDAGEVARRHGVPVHIPSWMGRVADRVDAPVERYTLTPTAAFRTIPCRPLPMWDEVFLYHDATGTLVVPDSLGTVDHWTVGAERLGVPPFRRLQPPTVLRGLEPDRVLVGHGEPVTEGATDSLETALTGVRRQFPRAMLENGPDALRGVLAALRG